MILAVVLKVKSDFTRILLGFEHERVRLEEATILVKASESAKSKPEIKANPAEAKPNQPEIKPRPTQS